MFSLKLSSYKQKHFNMLNEMYRQHRHDCVITAADLYSPDLGEFVQRQFAPQQLNDSLDSLTVLSLVNVTWDRKIFNNYCEYCQP